MTLLARHLKRDGYDVEVMSEIPHYREGQHDLFICSRPGPAMVDFLFQCLKAGKQVIVDMDDDFYAIPKSNPAYPFIGAGAENGLYHKKLRDLFKNVQCLTYSTAELAARYKRPGVVIPNYWDEENPQWAAPIMPAGRDYVTIGWSGTATHHEDFKLCEKYLHQAFLDHPNLHLVIGNDLVLYNHFSDLPENRKLFIPGLSYENYPIFFRYTDVMVAPLVDNYFNRAKSEVKLIECGARGIPWVASPLPFYQEWGNGGLIAGGPGVELGWNEALNSVVESGELRNKLGASGHEKSLTRTSETIYPLWKQLIEGMIG
jgi:hypothetical protein